MLPIHQLISIFCEIDDFCNKFEDYIKGSLLASPLGSCSKRGPECSLSDSEIMTILITFQMSGFRHFKAFYSFLKTYWDNYFPTAPSYHRFIELIKRVIFSMTLFVQMRKGKQTGIYYIDSSSLPVCNIRRSKRHKTFSEIAKYGKTSIGWFFGLKLHLVINDKGELMAFKLSKGDMHDSKTASDLLGAFKGLAFGDKGYLGKKIFDALFEKGLKLITRKRKNMKEQPLNEYEKQLLNQRNLIETVIEHLKHHYQVWHTRHRSMLNALTHLMAALAAYVIAPLKLSAIKLLSKNSERKNAASIIF